MNLFLSTRSLTSASEDHLTEFFAAALELSEALRDAYFEVAIKDFAIKNNWGSCSITGVRTQKFFEGSTCCLDMVLTLTNKTDTKVIVCEHKLEAPETLGPEIDERGQLSRYLDLKEIDGPIYVRTSVLAPEANVLSHPKYIQPAKRAHFLWRDFYSLFENAPDLFMRWMKEGFEHLGFTPPHPLVGDLNTEADRRNFAKFRRGTCDSARRLGWDHIP